MEDKRTYAIMAKPVGSRCNLHCDYCYYLDKPAGAVMSGDVLEEYTKQVIAVHGKDAEIEFAWHGGEPTLAGRAFYENALAFQEKYGKGRVIRNSLQTNATLLDDDWCRLFREHGFLLGVSVDGPEESHNRYRGNSYKKVMDGIELLNKHQIPFNTLTAVHAGNCREPERVYSFLRELTDHIQFLPVVESRPALFETDNGLRFAKPPGIYSSYPSRTNRPAEFCLKPDDFGKFLCGILDVWIREDIGKKFVQLFENALGMILEQKSGLCAHDAICGHSVCVSENGDAHCCDRYCYDDYRLGNILTEPLSALLEKNRDFGMHKTYGLTDKCYDCEYVKLCFGGCPKDRISAEGQNYLCESYRMFFAIFTSALRNDRRIMQCSKQKTI